MIVLDVAQGGEAWLRARCGVATASNFKNILTAAGAPSMSARRYMDALLAERREPFAMRAQPKSKWMQRGIELEPQARDEYSRLTGHAVAQVGLVYLDSRKQIAASPDGLIGDDGVLEIKCPAPPAHTDAVARATMPNAHIAQVQGLLWVTGRRWCDFFSYHPEYAPLCVRVWRDEAYIATLGDAVERFIFDLQRRENGC